MGEFITCGFESSDSPRHILVIFSNLEPGVGGEGKMRLDMLSCCKLSDKEIQHITDRRHQRILINVFLEGKAMGAQKNRF